MLAGMIDRLAGSGIFAWAAVADTWGTAHALARYAGRSILISPPGTAEASIAPLPTATLRLPSALVDNLRTPGFDRIGNLLAPPRPHDRKSLVDGKSVSGRVNLGGRRATQKQKPTYTTP